MSDEPRRPAIAVALEYDRDTHNAPKVVASGKGVIAEKIIEVARENGIVIEANPMLAEALSGVPVEDTIPRELYSAVAEVIGFVLRAQRR